MLDVTSPNVTQAKTFLKNNQPINVAFHVDADAIGALALVSKVLKTDYVYCPVRFGDYKQNFEIEKDGIKTKAITHLALDSGTPKDPEYTNVVIDHHPNHPTDPKYTLVWDNVPTGLIVYNMFKDEIPPEERWKVVISIVGDGQPELIPNEIWDSFPILLEERGKIYKGYKGVIGYPNYVYSMLSSPINSMSRTGDLMDAYRLVKNARGPDDILYNPRAIEDMKIIQREETRLLTENQDFMKIKNYVIGVISSKYSMSSRVIYSFQKAFPNKTLIIINKDSGEISIRGDHAVYLSTHLSNLGFTAGGHPGYCGASLNKDQTVEDFISAIRMI